jgi:hypothetical protein
LTTRIDIGFFWHRARLSLESVESKIITEFCRFEKISKYGKLLRAVQLSKLAFQNRCFAANGSAYCFGNATIRVVCLFGVCTLFFQSLYDQLKAALINLKRISFEINIYPRIPIGYLKQALCTQTSAKLSEFFSFFLKTLNRVIFLN